ncbi:hypothetical protein ABZX75_17385 [Streptomyces sp. NPDC003038]|uniref:hypothetical protein n=1 Tax=unclassified Streptomyces TaxID=2593676 RepID=UPI0033A69AB1
MDLSSKPLLQRLGIAPVPKPEPEREPEPDPEVEAEKTEEAPEPAPAVTVPEQTKTLRPGDRAPNWWEPKPVITSECEHPNPRTFRIAGYDQPIPFWCPDCKADLHPAIPDDKPTADGLTPAELCEHPAPHEVRNKVTGQLVAYWCADCETQLSVPDDYDELADVTEADDEEDGEEDEDDDGGEGEDDGKPVDKVPPAIRRIWGMRGNAKKTYSRPTYGREGGPKKSLLDAWAARDRKTRHLLYNGTALGIGWYLGVPQWFTAEVAYLDATYDSWTDFYVCIWYGVAVAIWALDHRTRNWLPPFALATRIPLVSMIVGVLLYGTPAA